MLGRALSGRTFIFTSHSGRYNGGIIYLMATGFKLPKRKYFNTSNNQMLSGNTWSTASPGQMQQAQGLMPSSGGAPLGQPSASFAQPQQSRQASPYLPDSFYTEQMGLTNSKLNDAIAGAANDENALATAYGVTYNRDGSGNISGTSIADNVDVTNPFSKAALLKQSYGRSQRSTTNSYAGMGQFGSGAYENAQKQNTFNNEQGRDSIIKNFSQGIQGILERRKAAQQLAAEEKLAAERALLERQIAAREVEAQQAAAEQSAQSAPYLQAAGDNNFRDNWGGRPTSNQDIVNYLQQNFSHSGTGPTLSQAFKKKKKR